jgi:prepilin-type N-terminal cleavage/methylation domain-containing protein
MQSRRPIVASRKARRGFTLIELLVVISIIATLMSLILPAIQNAREAGRRTQCLNNIRNVTVAALNFASSNKSRLPALSYYVDDPTTTPLDSSIAGRSWVVELLPYMDQQSTYDRWNKDVAWDNTTVPGPGGETNRVLATTLYIDALACPNDESAFQIEGGLSYVANSGFGDSVAATSIHNFQDENFDWDVNNTPNEPADDNVTKDTGVFWTEFESIPNTRNASATVGKIYDGTGNTLMYGENVNAGNTSWANPHFSSCSFIFPVVGGPANDGDLDKASNVTIGNLSGAIPAGTNPYINELKNGPEGAPHLNSRHPGIVVVSFCDGSAKTLSENIDQNVYTSLITPSGTELRRIVNWRAENPVSASDF